MLIMLRNLSSIICVTMLITSTKEDAIDVVVVCLSVCRLATLRKNFQTDLHDIFREGWQWANEQKIKFWWRSGR